MKKFCLILSALIMMSVASKAETSSRAIYYEAPVFDESEWTYIGMGSTTPGVLDYFSNEFPEDLDCKVYKSNVKDGDYWIAPDLSIVDLEQFMAINEFILHAQNPEAVWTSPIWSIHPMIFCFFPIVPEILGIQGNAKNYGKQDGFTFTFPANSYMLGTMPSDTPVSNKEGTFSITIPDEAGIASVAADDVQPVYYNLQGVQVANPHHGVFIEKRGNVVKKVSF